MSINLIDYALYQKVIDYAKFMPKKSAIKAQ